VISDIAFLLFAPGPFDDVRRRAKPSVRLLVNVCVTSVCMGVSISLSLTWRLTPPEPTPVVPRVARCTHNFAGLPLHSFPFLLFSHSSTHLTHSPIKECLQSSWLFFVVCEVRLKLRDECEIKTVSC
jgi:hypothetical protein